MAKMEVEVKAKITVPDSVIDQVLRLLEIWQEDNPDKRIESETIERSDGLKTRYYIKHLTEVEKCDKVEVEE